MVSKKNKAELRQKKHARIRNRLSGTPGTFSRGKTPIKTIIKRKTSAPKALFC